jgi:hypothetical protein
MLDRLVRAAMVLGITLAAGAADVAARALVDRLSAAFRQQVLGAAIEN